MYFVLPTDRERGLKVVNVLGLDKLNELLVNLLLPFGEVLRLLLVELLLLGLVQILRSAKESESEAFSVNVAVVDLAGGDDNVSLWNSSEWDLVNTKWTSKEYVTILKLVKVDGTLASILTRKDDDDTTRLEALTKWLVVWLSIDESLGVWADGVLRFAIFTDEWSWHFSTRKGVEYVLKKCYFL